MNGAVDALELGNDTGGSAAEAGGFEGVEVDGSSGVSYDLQPQPGGHGVEVAVVVEQGVAARDAEGADQQVDDAADRDTLGAQAAMVQGGGDGDVMADHGPAVESRVALIGR